MDFVLYTRFAFALLFVLGLLGAVAYIVRRYGLVPGLPNARAAEKKAEKRLAIVETLSLDPKRKLVLVRHDNREHLVLLGDGSESLINAVPNAHPDAPSDNPPQLKQPAI